MKRNENKAFPYRGDQTKLEKQVPVIRGNDISSSGSRRRRNEDVFGRRRKREESFGEVENENDKKSNGSSPYITKIHSFILKPEIY